jgi:hypothetical protein
VALLLPGWLYAGYKTAQRGAVPVEPEQRERYLAEQLPLYPAVAQLNHLGSETTVVYAFGAEQMKYHYRGTLLGELVGPASHAWLMSRAAEPETLYDALRGLGVRHLLLALDQRLLRLPDTVEYRKRFQRIYADPHAEIYVLRCAGPPDGNEAEPPSRTGQAECGSP